MKHRWREALIGLVVSAIIAWVCALAGYLLIKPLFQDYASRHEIVSLFILRPEKAIGWGIALSVGLALHWGVSGLLCKPNFAKLRWANAMLLAALVFAMVSLFEQAGHDFLSFSLFCGADEPIYIEFDISFECRRTRSITSSLTVAAFLLPILAIPMRVFESFRKVRE